MNVWSKGLGNMSLELDLEKATLSTVVAVDPDGHRFVFSGIIESVWWEYAASLTGDDMVGFVRVLSSPRVASLLASAGGGRLLLRFVGRLIMFGLRFTYLLIAKRGAASTPSQSGREA